MCLKIVGEAASRIVADHLDFTQANASIPWRSIRGMRNRIAYGYFDIDLHVVWQTVAELPSLIASLSKISRYPPPWWNNCSNHVPLHTSRDPGW